MKSRVPVILVVDDEPETVKYLRMNLMARSYEVVTASDGVEALDIVNERSVDLVLLDITMPGMDGFQVCRRIREKSRQIKILILSARGMERDKVVALDFGADDYMTKPFGVEELLARVRAVLRRINGTNTSVSKRVAFDGCEFDPSLHRVIFGDGEEVKLTPKEFSLLSLLISNAGKVVTHRTILSSVWGPEYLNDEHYLWTYIRRLRSKLKDDAKTPRILFTESGVGYRFTSNVKEVG